MSEIALLAWIAVNKTIYTHLDASPGRPIFEIVDPVSVHLCHSYAHNATYPMGYCLSRLRLEGANWVSA